MSVAKVGIVVPCYNEADRLDSEQFISFVSSRSNLQFIFVNDGSSDSTEDILQSLSQQNSAQIHVLTNETNLGKGEATRLGIRKGLELGVDFVGYWDADLSTSLESIDEFLEVLAEKPEVNLVIGSRVKLLGRKVERKLHRHYFGRLFATFASMTLNLGVYDTQCGAKLFRVAEETPAIFEKPFISRWVFDVEIIFRIMKLAPGSPVEHAEKTIYEYPLNSWEDLGDSKVRPIDFVYGFIDLFRIRFLT